VSLAIELRGGAHHIEQIETTPFQPTIDLPTLGLSGWEFARRGHYGFFIHWGRADLKKISERELLSDFKRRGGTILCFTPGCRAGGHVGPYWDTTARAAGYVDSSNSLRRWNSSLGSEKFFIVPPSAGEGKTRSGWRFLHFERRTSKQHGGS